MKKCITCDGLGYHYNQATFQSEHCLECNGTGVITQAIISHDLGGPIVVREGNISNDEPVIEAPKPKKSAKVKPVVDEPVETSVEPQADEIATDGQPE